MMADGWGPGEFILMTFILSVMSWGISSIDNTLKSIDEKMHTHAADGSINGIRGWY